jgi:hypothetical protein
LDRFLAQARCCSSEHLSGKTRQFQVTGTSASSIPRCGIEKPRISDVFTVLDAPNENCAESFGI